jgi:hypothetical protein
MSLIATCALDFWIFPRQKLKEVLPRTEIF